MKNILFAFIVLSLHSCTNPIDHQKDEIICSTIFKTITIEVKGPKLDSFYVQCLSNQNIIENNPFEADGYYPILSDRAMGQLKNSQDSFLFVGILNDSTVIAEKYIIGADDCHIYYISGRKSINL